MAQFDFGEEDEKSNMRKWGSEHIRNYFSLSTGIVLPVSDFNQTGQYSTQPGYAKTGYHVGAGVHYYFKQYFGVSGSFRYSSLQHNAQAYAEEYDDYLQLASIFLGITNLPPTTVESGTYDIYTGSLGASVRSPTIENVDFEFGVKLTYNYVVFPRIVVKNDLFVTDLVEEFNPKSHVTVLPFGRAHIRFSDNMGFFLLGSFNPLSSDQEYVPNTPNVPAGTSFPIGMKHTILGAGVTFVFS